MGVIERISEAIAAGDGSLSGAGLEARARRMLESESPWRIEQSLVPVIDRVLGLGILQPLLSDSLVTDILVNGPDQVWIDRGDGLTITDLRFESVEEI
ncbi:MAG: hypothetical protein WBM90_08190, partial [Acidimicrobiia bacterium]